MQKKNSKRAKTAPNLKKSNEKRQNFQGVQKGQKMIKNVKNCVYTENMYEKVKDMLNKSKQKCTNNAQNCEFLDILKKNGQKCWKKMRNTSPPPALAGEKAD